MSVMPASHFELLVDSLDASAKIEALSKETGLAVEEITAAFAAAGPEEFNVRQYLQIKCVERFVQGCEPRR